MEWYNYFGCFFAGVFLTNTVPHFVQGVSGNKFPTPFAKPPGKGLSSPRLNVLWGLINMTAGSVLAYYGKLSTAHIWSILIFFSGITLMSFFLGQHFTKRDRE